MGGEKHSRHSPHGSLEAETAAYRQKPSSGAAISILAPRPCLACYTITPNYLRRELETRTWWVDISGSAVWTTLILTQKSGFKIFRACPKPPCQDILKNWSGKKHGQKITNFSLNVGSDIFATQMQHFSCFVNKCYFANFLQKNAVFLGLWRVTGYSFQHSRWCHLH